MPNNVIVPREPRTTGYRFVVLLVLWTLVAFPGFAKADIDCAGESFLYPKPTDPRVRTGSVSVNGRDYPFNVLLPPGYDANPTRRYPVVYALHGGFNNQDTWLTGSPRFGFDFDLVEFTASLPPEQQAIVVLPYSGPVGFYTDWHDGVHEWETAHIRYLLPWIDSHYRTIADGLHRAVMGFSMGSFGALHYATRYPDLFAAVGSFSGGSVPATDGVGAAVFAALTATNALCGEAVGSPWGDPITEPVWFHDYSAAEVAANLGRTVVYVTVGNGVPCDLEDVQHMPVGCCANLEGPARQFSETFRSSLIAAGIQHRADFYNCGIHWPRYWNRFVKKFWPIMLGAFARAPSSDPFDYRSARSAFTVWGWTFAADVARAPEFLSIADASCKGFGLSGSGTETVTTAPCFAPNQLVSVSGAAESSALADAQGRVTVHVNLGPAHRYEQYTVPARALEAVTGYWKTKTVTFGS